MPRKSLADLTHDPQNPRKHNPRNIGMIETSLQRYGALRGIVIDEDDVILAGNGVVEAAMQAGLEEVEIIDLDDPSRIVALRASHLTEEQKREYAVADNRTTDLSEWDVGVLMSATEDDGLDLSAFFFKEELDKLFEDEDDDPRAPKPDPRTGPKWDVVVTCQSRDDADDVRELLLAHGYEVKERRA